MDHQLHVVFFPLMAHGHMLPTIDMAKLFSTRGVKVTLITTHYHSPMFSKSIESTKNRGFDISVRSFVFPSNEAGLPEGIHTLDQAMVDPETLVNFQKACRLMQESLELLLEEFHPNALVADISYPWATDSAAKFGIPRLLFHGSSSFAMCAWESVRRNRPCKNLRFDSDEFVVPDIPHKIKLTRGEISIQDWKEDVEETEMMKLLKEAWDSEGAVYGVVVNSFYELEPDYVDYYKNVLGRRAWNIGPFLLSNNTEDHENRGKQSAIDAHECLKWLDSKDPSSVVYVCFGSMASFKAAQLHEIATGLEDSDQEFIWVVRKCVDEEDQEKWLPEGFEKRVVKKGLIIKGWAPQLLILQHESVGCFVTHCGWNSTLEGVCAGVPLVTWPLFAEQFYNEKLVTDVLRTGLSVGCQHQQWSVDGEATEVVVKKEAISNAIRKAMVGDEAIKMRGRAEGLTMMAKKAVEEGGSSFSDLSALLEDLSSNQKVNNT